MFICEECHKGNCDYVHFSGSVGPCEVCGKQKVCHDCHKYHFKRQKEERGIEQTKAWVDL